MRQPTLRDLGMPDHLTNEEALDWMEENIVQANAADLEARWREAVAVGTFCGVVSHLPGCRREHQ